MGMNTLIPLPVLFQAGLLEQNQTMLQVLLKKQHEFSPQKHIKAWCSIRPPFQLTSAFHGKPSSPGPRDAHSTGVRPGCGISPPRDHCRYLSHESRTQDLNPRISGHYHRIAVKLKVKKQHQKAP